MSLAEELLADLEEDGFDDCEPMLVEEESNNKLDDAPVFKKTGNVPVL